MEIVSSINSAREMPKQCPEGTKGKNQAKYDPELSILPRPVAVNQPGGNTVLHLTVVIFYKHMPTILEGGI